MVCFAPFRSEKGSVGVILKPKFDIESLRKEFGKCAVVTTPISHEDDSPCSATVDMQIMPDADF